MKETLYDIARHYSANPLHKPTDESEWYQFERRLNRRLNVEQVDLLKVLADCIIL